MSSTPDTPTGDPIAALDQAGATVRASAQALANAVSAYHHTLIENGVYADHAFQLTYAYQQNLLASITTSSTTST